MPFDHVLLPLIYEPLDNLVLSFLLPSLSPASCGSGAVVASLCVCAKESSLAAPCYLFTSILDRRTENDERTR